MNMSIILPLIISLTLFFFVIEPGFSSEKKIMVAINEDIPLNIKAIGYNILLKFLEDHKINTVTFPEIQENYNQESILKLMDGNYEKLLNIAQKEGCNFLICCKLKAMETGTITVYDTTLKELQVFGEMKLFTIQSNKLPIVMKLDEKGLSMQAQESYQQAMGKAFEAIQKTIMVELKIK